MERKQSNLCLGIDVTIKADLLRIVDAVGPQLCLLKTHMDIVEDFDHDLIVQMQALSEKHDFLIFEDRKFADIGNTVTLQYSRGVHKISSWAHITNAHAVPGPGIVAGLKSVGLPLGRGLLLLAEMSSAGNLATGEYTATALEMARANKDFVIGFIAMGRIEERYPAPLPRPLTQATDRGVLVLEHSLSPDPEDWLVLTPGVGLDVGGDGLGQQYRTPHEVVFESGCDVIIVGRGIYGEGSDTEGMKRQAQRYREEGWKAYLARIKQE